MYTLTEDIFSPYLSYRFYQYHNYIAVKLQDFPRRHEFLLNFNERLREETLPQALLRI